MAQFYRAEKLDYIDNPIYQPPIDLMAKVIESKDKLIDETSAMVAAGEDSLLKADAIAEDSPYAQEIVNQYRQRINDVTSLLQSNPLEYLNQMSSIKKLGSDLQQELTTGALGVYNNQKQQLVNWRTEQLKRAGEKDSNINIGDVDRIYASALNKLRQAGGTNYKGPNEYNNVGNYLQQIIGSKDAMTLGDEYGKGFLAEIAEENRSEIDEGGNIWDVETYRKQTSPERVYTGVIDRLQADQNLMDSYRQKIYYGLMTPEEVQRELHDAGMAAVTKYAVGHTKDNAEYIGLTPQAKAAMEDAYDQRKEARELADAIYLDQVKNQNDLNLAIQKDALGLGGGTGGNAGSDSSFERTVQGNSLTAEERKQATDRLQSAIVDLSVELKIPTENGKYTADNVIEALNKRLETARQNGNVRDERVAKQALAKFNYIRNTAKLQQQNYSWESGLQANYTNAEIAKHETRLNEYVTNNPARIANTKMDWVVDGKTYKNMTFQEVKKDAGLEYSSEIGAMLKKGSAQPLYLGQGNSNILINFVGNIGDREISATSRLDKLGINF